MVNLDELRIEIPCDYVEAVRAMGAKVIQKHNRFCQITFGTPFRPKSTGPESQNSHAWGHCRQIAGEIGDDIRAVMREAQIRAIPMGYPFKSGRLGPVPTPWEEASSAEASLVIEALHGIASFIPMRLKEDSKWKLFDTRPDK